jgi:hypothetical protein
MISTSYHALTSVGAIIKTFDDPKAARKWASANSETYPGMSVEEVVTTVTRHRIYRPQIRLVASS